MVMEGQPEKTDAAAAPALLVEDVRKEYLKLSLLRRRQKAPPTVALRDISFSVKPGETIGLLGPNGAGKTTTLKIIATLLYPTSGRVLLNGVDAFADSVRARGMMGLVTCDERSFYWRLTGYQNLRFFAALYGLTPQQFKSRSEELLETLELTEAAHRPYHGYSTGMKQKLAIARGLLSEPRLVLYDEPTRSLDPLSTQNIRRWILQKRRTSPGQTHVIATNQLDEAEQLCDRVLIINRGTIIASGAIPEVRRRWNQRNYDVHRISFRGSLPLNLIEADPGEGIFEVTEEPAAEGMTSLRLRLSTEGRALSRVLDALLRADLEIVSCDLEEVPFDEVFCSLVLGDQDRSAVPREVART